MDEQSKIYATTEKNDNVKGIENKPKQEDFKQIENNQENKNLEEIEDTLEDDTEIENSDSTKLDIKENETLVYESEVDPDESSIDSLFEQNEE